MAALLEIARTLVKVYGAKGEGLTNSLRLCWWGVYGEGVDYYVNNMDDWEWSKQLLFLDIHGIAAPNGLNSIKDGTQDPNSPKESDYISEQFRAKFTARNENFEMDDLYSSSEYARFFKKGIPIGGLGSAGWGLKTAEQAELFGGQAGVDFDECFDEPCDTPDNIGLDRLTLITGVLAEVVNQFLLDADLPVRFGKKQPMTTPAPSGGWGLLQWAFLAGGVLIILAMVIVIVVFVMRTQPSNNNDGIEMGSELQANS